MSGWNCLLVVCCQERVVGCDEMVACVGSCFWHVWFVEMGWIRVELTRIEDLKKFDRSFSEGKFLEPELVLLTKSAILEIVSMIVFITMMLKS